MKKIIATVLAVVMLLGCMVILASCSATPETDFKTAKKNLEKQGYFVVITENKDYELGLGVDSVLKAYDLDEFEEKMQEEDEDFDLDEYIDDLEKIYTEDEEFDKALANAIGTPVLTIYKFDDTEMANFYYDRYKIQDDYEKEYEDKYSKVQYEMAQHMLEEYSRDLRKEDLEDQKEQYENIVEDYERDLEMVYGKDGTFFKDGYYFWYGSKEVIEASQSAK